MGRRGSPEPFNAILDQSAALARHAACRRSAVGGLLVPRRGHLVRDGARLGERRHLGGISGYFLARHKLLDIALEPYLAALYSLPRVALAPLFILWFGIGLLSKVMLAVSIVYFIMHYSVYSGVKNVDPDLINAVRTMGAKEGYLTRHIVLPSCVPFIFSGLRISLGMALIGTVIGEMIASQKGMGRLIAIASGNFDTTGLFSTFVMLAAMAMLLGALMKAVETRLQRWQQEPSF